jgi:hypothetical protein
LCFAQVNIWVSSLLSCIVAIVDAKSALNAKTHIKPNKAGFTRAESERRASQFFLKINKRQSS